MIEFVVKIEARLLAEDIDGALNILGHHLVTQGDDAYQLLPGSEIDIWPANGEEDVNQ